MHPPRSSLARSNVEAASDPRRKVANFAVYISALRDTLSSQGTQLLVLGLVGWRQGLRWDEGWPPTLRCLFVSA